MSYASPSAVAALCRNLLGEFRTWTDSSCPTRQQVDGWLSSGCSVIETSIAAKGYSTPVASTSGAYAWLTNLNTLYAAAFAELSRANATIGPGERTRGQVFWEMFNSGMEDLLRKDLSALGVDRASRGAMYAGGTKVSEKQTWEATTDRVTPRFMRGQFEFPATMDPNGTTAS